MLQNSEPTFAAVCACERAKQVNQVTTQLFFQKLRLQSSKKDLNTQTGAVTVTLHQLSFSIRQTSECSNIKSRHQLPTESHGCSTFLTSMDKIPAVHLFFLMHGPIGLESMMCKVLSRQRVFMNQLLGHRTLVTLRSSQRQDDQNLNLVSSCVGHAETALVSSTCTVTAQSFQQVTWRLLKFNFA